MINGVLCYPVFLLRRIVELIYWINQGLTILSLKYVSEVWMRINYIWIDADEIKITSH